MPAKDVSPAHLFSEGNAMHYTMTAYSAFGFNEDQQERIFDVLGDHYDSATIQRTSINVDGTVASPEALDVLRTAVELVAPIGSRVVAQPLGGVQ